MHLLLATDLGTEAEHSAAYAISLFGVQENQYTLLHAAENAPGKTQVVLARAVERLRTAVPHLVLTSRTEEGSWPLVVDRVAEEKSLPHVLALALLANAPESAATLDLLQVCARRALPVLWVPHEATYKDPERIMLADAGSTPTRQAAKLLLDLARWHRAQVLIAQVLSEGMDPEAATAEAAFDEVLGGVPHSLHTISSDHGASALSSMAWQNNVDLLVIAHREANGNHLFRTAMHTALEVQAPLLVLHQ
jgi:hypothetical protein